MSQIVAHCGSQSRGFQSRGYGDSGTCHVVNAFGQGTTATITIVNTCAPYIIACAPLYLRSFLSSFFLK